MIIQEVRETLRKHADPAEKKKRIYWEKMHYERPRLHGVPTPMVRKISASLFRNIRNESRDKILQLCEGLLARGYTEERTIAFDWAFRIRRHFRESDFHLFESWLERHVHTWGACDDLCTHAFGAFILRFPEFIQKVKKWTKASNRWMRRASAVVWIYSIRRKEHLDSIFETADALLTDSDIMVQKGYGWMLKEATRHYPEEVFDYVMRHREEMPRTALRYAIEKLSPEQRREAMKRD